MTRPTGEDEMSDMTDERAAAVLAAHNRKTAAMTDIEMLPLPKPEPQVSVAGAHEAMLADALEDYFDTEAVQSYARAVAEHNVRFLTHELANAECAIDAEQAGRKKAEDENEALRAEREVIVAEAVKYAGKSGRLEAKVEQLAEALRAVVADMREWGEPAKGAHVERIQRRLDDALRDHDQEGKDG